MAPLRHRLIECLTLGAVVLLPSAAVALPSVAVAEDAILQWNVDGIRSVGLSATELKSLGTGIRGAFGAPAHGPWVEVVANSVCAVVPPGGTMFDVQCSREWALCQRARNNGGERPSGPAVNVWTRLVDDAGRPVDASGNPVAGDGWQMVGFTCLPHLVPGAGNVLTMADIVRQFHDTHFAKAQVSVQPVGGTTLVNLPTYFELVWSAAGFAPDEVDTTVLLGRTVRIRPTFKSAHYVFGDGSSSGATGSLGGPYPDGDVVHTYVTAQNVSVRVDVTYGGQFSVDGGDWVDIPGDIVVRGVEVPLRVAEARARLYAE